MEPTTGHAQKVPLIFRQNSATQPAGTSRISSAKQPPLSGTPTTTATTAEPASPTQPSANSALVSSAQFPPTKHISTATQPPSHTASNTEAHTNPGWEGLSDTKDSSAQMRDSNMQREGAKPNKVSDIIYALRHSTTASTWSDQSKGFKTEAKVGEGASAFAAFEDKPATPKSPTLSDKVEVILRDGRLTFTECSSEGSTGASSQVPISQMIAAMEKSATRASYESVITHIASAADLPSNRATSRRNENSEKLEFTPGKTAPNLPSLAPKLGSNRPKISPPTLPSDSHGLPPSENQQPPPSGMLQPPPIPARKVTLTPANKNSSAGNQASAPTARSHLPVSDRPLPPTPPSSDTRPLYTNRPPAPLPTNRDKTTNQSSMKTATLPPVNLRPTQTAQSKTNSLPPRFRIANTKDLSSPDKQNTQVKGGGQYETLIYEQDDGDVQSRILKIEETQLKLRSILQKEQNEVLDEVKRLSASVEHLKTWTLRCQEMLISDTSKCQESVESLKARSNEVTRLLREHIIQISQDVSKASAKIFPAETTKEHMDNRVMHVFDWNLQLIGGSDRTLTSHPYHIKEVNISLTGAAQFMRDGIIYLKVLGDSTGKMMSESELSGNFTCKVCITDASDTMPDWCVGKVMGNLFKDSEWVVGTVSVSEVKDKSYCAEGKTFKVKYAVDLYK